ncbi:5-histidylcysteine_sulfoxide synthase [Hexamita inflata]|uniref:Partial n=1 Tax=Hexamita inflata TaxID=28002 RepID=A0AA86PUL9_9EUKA|nr:5-histidylcysteine sulfoxide synthase [Hexamita inflata]
MNNLRSVLLTGENPEKKRAEILESFNDGWAIYERIYEQLPTDDSWYKKPIPIRHPLIFYYGHTAAFFVNKLNISKFSDKRIDPKTERMVAIGVDEMSWDDLNEAHYDWPTVAKMHEFRQLCKALVLEFISTMPIKLPITQEDPAWIILMGIEHQHIHLETSSVLIRQQKLELVKKVFEDCPNKRTEFQDVPKNKLIKVAAQIVHLGKKDATYGWDNEYGTESVALKEFHASEMKVSNAEYLEFVLAYGYSQEKYWTEEGWKWVQWVKTDKPTFWVGDLQDFPNMKLRTAAEEVEMPWDWPVEVNYLEAKAFCNYKSETDGKKTRLITEPEWQAIAKNAKPDTNICLKYFSTCPVDQFKQGDFYDVYGNVWQWTETFFHPLEGFKVHPAYHDFSTPCFDEKHNIMTGGSWVSCGNEAIQSARYAFRRHFFQFCGIRYVQDE